MEMHPGRTYRDPHIYIESFSDFYVNEHPFHIDTVGYIHLNLFADCNFCAHEHARTTNPDIDANATQRERH